MRLIIWLRRRAPWPIEIDLAEYAATAAETHAIVLMIMRSTGPTLFDANGGSWDITLDDTTAIAVIDDSTGA